MNSLTVVEVEKKVIEYSGSLELGDWKTFFTNNDETVCPITSCMIMKTGCTEEYLLSKIKVNETLNINAETTKEDDGWEDEICI